MDRDTTKYLFTIIGCLALIVVLLIFGGAISFALGWLGGLFLKWVCGDAVSSGLNMVLGNITQYEFTPDDIPLFSAIMTTIAGFFKSAHYSDFS
jgi:hypothetical protein